MTANKVKLITYINKCNFDFTEKPTIRLRVKSRASSKQTVL